MKEKQYRLLCVLWPERIRDLENEATRCESCGVCISISPVSQSFIATHPGEVETICLACAKTLIARTPPTEEIRPTVMPGQVKEIEHRIPGLDGITETEIALTIAKFISEAKDAAHDL